MGNKSHTTRAVRPQGKSRRSVDAVATRLGFTEEQAMELALIFGNRVPFKAEQRLIAEGSDAFALVHASIEAHSNRLGNLLQPLADAIRSIADLPTPILIVQYFRDTFGIANASFTILIINNKERRVVDDGVFGIHSNGENLLLWLTTRMAALTPEEAIILTVTVVESDDLVEVPGSDGPTYAPVRYLYQFWYSIEEGCRGFSEAETLALRTVNPHTGKYVELEPGIRCRSSKAILDMLTSA